MSKRQPRCNKKQRELRRAAHASIWQDGWDSGYEMGLRIGRMQASMADNPVAEIPDHRKLEMEWMNDWADNEVKRFFDNNPSERVITP
ncbi:hypothetical protein HP398_29740 [Brevibacillus sp. HB1.4B]|uniref:hypothetical protein n=1 Tax=Brevibacillus sp. HB1.4B TaxID=2738845 RepID=UPI00156B3FE8|nr:hypothetical protein [Brevibacillus sp. HB1.4B]NRS20605.1 hypothetical protein [Brevibacillus sp. HB1.4B]